LEQRIRFCTAADGLRLAYSAVGQGSALVVPPPWVSHQELSWQQPAYRRFCERLASNHTLVCYDRPGTGLSDHNRTEFSLDSDVQDLETVIDHLKLKRLALLGYSEAGPVSITYAAKHPRRVSHLVLYGTYARGEAIGTEEFKASLLSLVRAHWGVGSKMLTDIFAPDADAATIKVGANFQRESATPEIAAKILGLTFKANVEQLLHNLRVPTLVLHRRQDRAIPFRLGRELASLIANARFVPLEGRDHFPWLGGPDSVLRIIGEFLGTPLPMDQAVDCGRPAASDVAVAADDPVTRETISK
jgi:pimeloyl-ACP methyl ester carboxylesterase